MSVSSYRPRHLSPAYIEQPDAPTGRRLRLPKEKAMTTLVKRKTRPAPEPSPADIIADDAVYDPPGRPVEPERATRLPVIYSRSLEGRRIDFLELLAWTICRVEAMDADELRAFNEELCEVREREWGSRPWPGAKESDKFLMHVERMAEDFTTNPVRFRNRKRQPNPAFN